MFPLLLKIWNGKETNPNQRQIRVSKLTKRWSATGQHIMVARSLVHFTCQCDISQTATQLIQTHIWQRVNKRNISIRPTFLSGRKAILTKSAVSALNHKMLDKSLWTRTRYATLAEYQKILNPIQPPQQWLEQSPHSTKRKRQKARTEWDYFMHCYGNKKCASNTMQLIRLPLWSYNLFSRFQVKKKFANRVH